MCTIANDGTADTPDRPLCRCCGLPILKGQAHWAGDREGVPWHYACAEEAGLTTPWPSRPRGLIAQQGA